VHDVVVRAEDLVEAADTLSIDPDAWLATASALMLWQSAPWRLGKHTPQLVSVAPDPTATGPQAISG
jgi:hypothetical protein